MICLLDTRDLGDTPEESANLRNMVRYSDGMLLFTLFLLAMEFVRKILEGGNCMIRSPEMNADLRSFKVVVGNKLIGRYFKQSKFYLFCKTLQI